MAIQSETLKEKLRVCIYCYQNHPDIIEKDGIAHIQKETLLNYANEHPEYEVVMIVEDCATRDGLERVIQAGGEDKFDVLLIKDISRLGRDFNRVTGILNQMELSNVEVVDQMGGVLNCKKVCALYEILSCANEAVSKVQYDDDFRNRAIYIQAPLDADEQTVDEQTQKIIDFAENLGFQVESTNWDRYYEEDE